MENPPAPGHQDMAGFSNIKVGSQTEWSLLVEKQEGMQIVGNATFVSCARHNPNMFGFCARLAKRCWE